MATYLGRIQLLAKQSTDWAVNDAVLLIGEIGAANVGSMLPIIKIGDGVRPWSQLPNLMAPVDAANDYIAGTTTTLPAGSSATVTIDNTVDPPTISFGIPQGATGPANSLSIGTVTTSAPGGNAAASITGTPPNQILNLTIPRGSPGPANSLSIGTVTTVAPGTPASATITGTPPTQVLNLALPQGMPGDQAVGNPTALVGLTPKNGTSFLAIRTDGAPALDQAIVPTWSGAHTFTSSGTGTIAVRLHSAAPTFEIRESDAAANNQRWWIRAEGEALRFAVADDAGANTEFLKVDRTGAVVDSLAFNATEVSFSGIIKSTYVGSGNNWGLDLNSAQPGIRWYESDASADNRGWRMLVAAETLRFEVLNDSGGTSGSIFQVTRSGAAVAQFNVTATAFNWNGASLVNVASSPTWTGTHTFQGTAPRIFFNSTGAAADQKRWHIQSGSTGAFNISTRTDADGAGAVPLTIARTGTAIDLITLAGASIVLNAGGATRATISTPAAGVAALRVHGSTNDTVINYGTNQDTFIRPGTAAGIVYIGDAGTAAQIIGGTHFRTASGLANIDASKQLNWNGGAFTHGTIAVYGSSPSGWTGFICQDGSNNNITLMGHANGDGGVYHQGDSKWLISREDSGNVLSTYTFSAPAFNSTSSRAIKRETGTPRRAADLLARLRPILYRLLQGDEREQLGLIAEEVHEVCPQLSDGKTVAYDRLALLLLCDWQATRGLALG